MGPIRQEVDIDAPRERVFGAIADLGSRPAFTAPYQADFRLERIESTGIGAAARFRSRPGSSWFATELVSLEPPHRIVEHGFTGRLNRVPTRTVWELVETPLGLTRVTLTFLTRPERIDDRLRERLTRATGAHSRGWRASLDRLRDQLEDGEAPLPRINVAGGNPHATGVA